MNTDNNVSAGKSDTQSLVPTSNSTRLMIPSDGGDMEEYESIENQNTNNDKYRTNYNEQNEFDDDNEETNFISSTDKDAIIYYSSAERT